MSEPAVPLESDWEPIDLDVSHLVTEDDTPVDNFFQDKQMNLLTDALAASWADNRPFLSASDVGIFYTVNEPPIVPDVILSLGVEFPPDVHNKKNRSYYIWLFGKPPEVVIEIVSNAKGGEDSSKLLDYARIRVPYYVIYDPDHHLSSRPIRLFELSPLHYMERLDRSFLDLGLGLIQWNGTYDGMEGNWLRWTDAKGNLLQTGIERAQTAEERAQTAEERAQIAEERLKAENLRREVLEKTLREAGLPVPDLPA